MRLVHYLFKLITSITSFWLRRLVRRNTKPIPINTAQLWKNRLSIMYALCAWNAFGFVLYMVYSGRRDWADAYGYKSEAEKALSPGQQWARTLDIGKGTIIRVKGLTKTEMDALASGNDELLEEGKH